MPGPSQENANNSLSGKVNAAPFIPGGSPQPKTPGASGSFPESAVKALPFVPGKSGSQINAQGSFGAQGGQGKGSSTKLAANAAAFVPRQADGSAGKGGRGSGHDAVSGSDGAAPASCGQGTVGGRAGGASTVPAASPLPSAAGASPAAGRGAASRGGRGSSGNNAAAATPPTPGGQFQPGRMAGGGQGRGGGGVAASGGGRGGPVPSSLVSSSSVGSSSPGPMQVGRGGARGGGSGGRGGPGGGSGYMAGGGGVMHHPAAASAAAGAMMGGGGFGTHAAHMGPMPMTTYGAGGGSHLPSYRPRDLYLAGPGRAYIGLHFVEEGLKQQLQHRSFMTSAQWHDETADDHTAAAAAYRLGPYHTLYPLEEGAMGPPAAAAGSPGPGSGGELPSAALGLRTSLAKGISSVDGSAAALRRIDPKQVIPTAELLSRARETVEQWAPLANHPNLVGLRAAFLTSDSLVAPAGGSSGAASGAVAAGGGGGQQAGGGGNGGEASALVLAHDFHPGAVTLAAAHLVPQMNAAGLVSAPQPPPEEVVWSYAVQITSALRAAHGCGLLLRPACLHPSKVLLTGFGRLRVGSVGVVDALLGGGPPGPEELQGLMRQDITAMGSLLLTICCAGAGPAPSLDLVAAHYSPELVRLLGALLAAAEGGGPLGSWRGLVAALADRAFSELDSTGVSLDHLVGELSKEVENGRLLRLLAKLNFVTDRPPNGAASGPPGNNGDASWSSESPDRYLLRLFRDFVFAAAAPESGAPLLDWGLLVEALNKVDAGVHEEILLLGRDGQSMLVVTYADVKRCLENAFSELKAAANSAVAAAAATASSSLAARGGAQSGRSGPVMRM